MILVYNHQDNSIASNIITIIIIMKRLLWYKWFLLCIYILPVILQEPLNTSPQSYSLKATPFNHLSCPNDREVWHHSWDHLILLPQKLMIEKLCCTVSISRVDLHNIKHSTVCKQLVWNITNTHTFRHLSMKSQSGLCLAENSFPTRWS